MRRNVSTLMGEAAILRPMLAMLMLAAGIPTASPTIATLREWQAKSAAIEQHAFANGRKLHGGSVDAKLRRGDLIVEQVGPNPESVSGGLIHHWIGTAFVSDARLPETVRAMQQYGDYGMWYAPDLQSAKVLSHDGDRYRVALR